MTPVFDLLSTLKSLGIRLNVDSQGNILVRGDKRNLTSDLIDAIKELKPSIVLLLQSYQRKKQSVSISATDRNNVFALSYSQQRLWLLDQIDSGSAHYNMPSALKLSGKIDYIALNQAFSTILERHESLRTSFAADEAGEPYQVIRPASAFSVPVQDLSMLEVGARELAIAERVREEAWREFDLSADLMLRTQLLKLAEDEHILLVTMHHIASDGWSMSILINEFSTLYRTYSQGLANPLPPLEIQYADYAHWQRTWLQGEVLDEQLGYWEQQLSDLPVAHSLPLDRPRPRLQSFTGRSHYSHIDITTSQPLSTLCQAQGATVFMGLQAAFSVLLSRYSNETDIVVGSPIANREQAEIAGLIGFFVNTLVLRSDLSANPSFSELLKQSKTMLLDAYAHQQVPFEQIVERLQPERSVNHSPLFQVMLILQNNEVGTLELPGLTLSPVAPSGAEVAKYDLTLNVSEDANGLFLKWEYNTDLFDASTIERMADHFNVLLASMVTNPQESVFTAEMLGEAERHQLLVNRNDTAANYPAETCLHELFEAQAESNPDATALVFDGQQLTYGELNTRANQLAHYLVTERQVQPETLVGICIERSLEMVVAILGVLKAGGAYVPLDPEYPAARLAYMLDDAALTTVVTQSHLQGSTPTTPAQAVCLDESEFAQQLALQPSTNLNSQQMGLTASHLAYVIYTSGSTGEPKGVMCKSQGVLNLLHSFETLSPVKKTGVCLLWTSLSFDVSVYEIMSALLFGRTLHVVTSELRVQPDLLFEYMVDAKITSAYLPPFYVNDFLEWLKRQAHNVLLDRLLVGVEPISLDTLHQINRLRPSLRIINGYGPSESSICSTLFAVEHHKKLASLTAPIGKPVGNTQHYVLDVNKKLLPQGILGELYIGGAGLARGYLNRPDLTAEKFIANPFYDKNAANSSELLYKTGDIVRWLPDGNLAFMGRIDHQVKIRGFRIELGEIENSLSTHDIVKDTLVLAQGTAAGDSRLVAYVVADTVDHNDDETAAIKRELITEQLRRHLSQCLPDYMVPAAFVLLNQLPLTPSGKVDRSALPEPALSQLQTEYVAPRTKTEKILCDIWQEVLGIERVGVSDNFFQLGGHSLLATRVVSRIHQQLDVALPLKTLFDSQSLDKLAQTLLILDSGLDRPELVNVAREGTMLPSYGQQRLWLLDKIDGGNAHYNMPGALKLSGKLDYNALNQAFNAIVERHESLRTCFAADEAGEPYQVIMPVSAFSIAVQDLSILEDSEREPAIAEFMNKEADRAFDLSNDLMLRGRLLKVTEDEHILLVTMHHIASDGWSMSILINEFSTLYRAYSQGQANPLPPLAIQYADYAHWQRNWLQGEVLDEQLSYWKQQLADLPVAHSLPLDRPRPQIQSVVGSTHYSQIDNTTSQALNALCQAQGATVFMGLHAAFSVLLSRYSNETDIVVGSPIANREQAEIAGLIGFFVNTLVLRSDLSTNPSFAELLSQSKTTLFDAYAHQQVPFEQIVECLQPARSLNHSPLFQVMLILQNNEAGTLELPGLTLNSVAQSGAEVAKYDLTLNVSESPEGLFLNWVYNTDLFDASTIARMAGHFNVLLASMVTTPQESVFTAEMLSEAERHQLLVDWNNTAADYPTETCIHELFEAQAESNPDAIALVFDGQQLTYGQLNRKANQLAHYLVTEKQVQPDTLVGICIERSLEMVVAILGVLKAGGAYVPLDPDYPAARLAYMLDDAALTTVITQSHMLDRTPITPVQAVCLDEPEFVKLLELQPSTNLHPLELGLTASHLAYVIYTSGSTGKPKGVMVEHISLVNYIYSLSKRCQNISGSFVNTNICFDGTATSFWLPFALGKYTKLSASSDADSLSDLVDEVCNADEPKLFKITPAHLDVFIQAINCSEHHAQHDIFVGGDIFSSQKYKNLPAPIKNSNFFNHYGPSEATVGCAVFSVNRNNAVSADSIPLGKPLNNVILLVLNPNGELCPPCVAGELYIGGIGLARGYLNRPALTAEKFIANPFYDKADPASCERLYKTGDLVRWLSDGNLEFLGRIDHQVKIRGFRIELGEIESSLSTHDSVKDAVVLSKESEAGDTRLVAYVVTDAVVHYDNETASTERQNYIEHLRRHASARLPEYMVPSAFVLLEQLPLTPNGKVDRKALPEPDFTLQQEDYLAPATETERVLCDIWQEVLGVARVGVTDNFFQLGGHSLLVMQVISRLQHAGIAMTARQLFVTPTPSDLAQAIDGAGEGLLPEFKAPANLVPDGCTHVTPEMLPLVTLTTDEIEHIGAQVPGGAGNVQDIYPLGPLQEGILFHHMMSTRGDPYAHPALFKIKGEQAVSELLASLQFVVNRHDVLRTAVLWNELSVPVQVVYRSADLPVSWIELEEGQDALSHMQRLCAPEIQHMDLRQGPLLKVQIARVPNTDQHLVLLQFHHIISDHVGLEIIQRELALYQAGKADTLAAPVPYREFVAHAQYQAEHNDAEIYFRNTLGDIEEPTAPFNLVDVQGDGSQIVEVKQLVPPPVSSQLRQIAREMKISPATLFHVAWAMVVASCSGRDDVVFGTVVSGRLQGTVGAEEMLGVFVNTLPLRVTLNGHSVAELVLQVQHALQDLLPYEQASLALAQRCTRLEMGAPLFSAMLNYRHSAVAGDATVDSETDANFEYIGGQERTNYPFNLSVDDLGTGFGLNVQIDASVSAERVASYIQTAVAGLASALAEAPDQPASSLSVLPEAERYQLLVDWNNTTADYPAEHCIHELFEAQAESNPDATALVFDGQQMTYGELNRKANQLAHYLITEKQVQPDTLVGICLERSLEMVIAILGVLKAGGAYVPLDPDYPAARLAYMLDDAQLTTVITQSRLLDRTSITPAQAVCLDDGQIQVQLDMQQSSDLSIQQLGLTASNLAYMIYTSGTTGKPKGVQAPHAGIHNRVSWMEQQFPVSEDEVFCQKTAVGFVDHVAEIFQALAYGRPLIIIRTQDTLAPEGFANIVAQHQITRLTLVPSLLKYLIEHDVLANMASLRLVISSGETLQQEEARKFNRMLPDAKLLNLYGSSEVGADVAGYLVDEVDELSRVPIGQPIQNTQLQVLNAQLELVPQGSAGELYIGGAGLARGYLNRPALTVEKFIANPFYDKAAPASCERLYKTGDLVRWLPDGNLEFLGRIDHQVKIRGFRIELGEIENSLSTHELVKDAVVLAKGSADGDKRLVAYVVIHHNDEAAATEPQQMTELMRQHLSESLPDYMVPSTFVLLEQLPLTPNGKVDRKALPEPDVSQLQTEYVAPRTETEKVLCDLWQEVLGVERVGITDNFFQLGGHSLLATRLLTSINGIFKMQLSLRVIFSEVTVKSAAVYIDTVRLNNISLNKFSNEESVEEGVF